MDSMSFSTLKDDGCVHLGEIVLVLSMTLKHFVRNEHENTCTVISVNLQQVYTARFKYSFT